MNSTRTYNHSHSHHSRLLFSRGQPRQWRVHRRQLQSARRRARDAPHHARPHQAAPQQAAPAARQPLPASRPLAQLSANSVAARLLTPVRGRRRRPGGRGERERAAPTCGESPRQQDCTRRYNRRWVMGLFDGLLAGILSFISIQKYQFKNI